MEQQHHTPMWCNKPTSAPLSNNNHSGLFSTELFSTCRCVIVKADGPGCGRLLFSEDGRRTETESFPGLITSMSPAFCANSCRQTRFHCLLWFRGSDVWKRVEHPVLLTCAAPAGPTKSLKKAWDHNISFKQKLQEAAIFSEGEVPQPSYYIAQAAFKLIKLLVQICLWHISTVSSWKKKVSLSKIYFQI